MRTITIDDSLYAKVLASAETHADEKTLITEAFETCIRLRAAQKLAALGGSQSDMQNIPRRRQKWS